MNKAARLIKCATRYDRVTPILMELHWLPVKARIMFKVACLVYKSIRSNQPNYLASLIRNYDPGSNILLKSPE